MTIDPRPTSSPPPPPPPAPPFPPPAPRRRVPSLSAASWLASTGAALLLVASIVVVASQWETITPEIQFSGLVAALLAIYFAAEAGRNRYPSTSTAMATLAASLTAPVGIAAASTLSQPWPVCVFVGGVTALVAAEVQSRRWAVPVLKAATAIAAGLAAAGLAALTGTPVALIGAGMAVAALMLGATRRSIALGTAVGFSPILLALADAGIGTGTLADIGATGAQLVWSAPISATIAAFVIGITAHRRNEMVLAAVSTSTFVSGVLVGLTVGHVSAVAWWCLPAIVLIATEMAALFARRSIWGSAATAAVAIVRMPLIVGGLLSPLAVIVGRFIANIGNFGSTVPASSPSIWALPLGLTAAALAVATAATHRRSETSRTFAFAFAAAACATLAAVMTTGSQIFSWPEAATIASIGVATAFAGRGREVAWGHSSALVFVLAAAMSIGLLGLSIDHTTLIVMSLTITLTGLAFLRSEFTPVDTAALAFGAIAAMLSFDASSAVVSLAMVTVTSQMLLYAVARRARTAVPPIGAALAMSLVSLWWTSGTNDAVIAAIRPFGADGADVALCAATLVLLLCGLVARRVETVSTWLAYSPGLGMAAAWLLTAQLDTNATWATIGALTFGVVATGSGGLRRLGAPLVMGTGIVCGTLLISAGPRLAEAPTWTWIATGGLTLLALAALVERSDKPLIVSSGDDELSMLQQFCHDFE